MTVSFESLSQFPVWPLAFAFSSLVNVHCGIITGGPDSAGGSSLDFEFMRECMRINKIRPKFFKMALEAKKQ